MAHDSASTASHPMAPLLTPEGWALLDSLPPYEESQAMALGARLRKEGHSPALIAAALTQQRLRAHATGKFGSFAASMLFTPDGLEQATRLAVAAHHAARYQAAGVHTVADLGCGIGGDALALAGLGLKVIAVELDEPTAALATVNLMPFEHARVECANALDVAGPGGATLAQRGVDAVFADPARRANGRRITDPERWSPAFSTVLSWREHIPALGIKIAPGIDHALLPADSHTQWVSVDGAVVEAAVWCGPLAPEGPGRSALLLTSAPTGTIADAAPHHAPHLTTPAEDSAHGEPAGSLTAHRLTDPDCTDPSQAPEQIEAISGVDNLGAYLYEPDGAAIRAGLVSYLASRLGARPVAPKIAYLTGDAPVPAELAPFVRAWRIVEVLPMHLKSLKKYVREQDLGRLEIHKRGVDVSPDALRASLRLRGSGAQIWAVTRLGSDGRGGPGKGAVLVLEDL